MKKNTFYLVALIFSISLFSSAKKLKGGCDGGSTDCQLRKAKPAGEADINFPTLGLFLFNN
ncbi:MAG TPA: hypothetical protein VF144_12570 [Chitinophagaceae bacterium]